MIHNQCLNTKQNTVINNPFYIFFFYCKLLYLKYCLRSAFSFSFSRSVMNIYITKVDKWPERGNGLINGMMDS